MVDGLSFEAISKLEIPLLFTTLVRLLGRLQKERGAVIMNWWRNMGLLQANPSLMALA